MREEILLSIDVGTQSVRALLFDLKGKILFKSMELIEPYISLKPGWAEQDPELFWAKICAVLGKLWTEAPELKQAIAGVTITTQRGSVVNVDQDGRPLRPAILWMDQRLTDNLQPIKGYWGVLFKLLNLTDTVGYLQANAESNWIQRHQPDIWRKTHKFLFLSGYLSYRLTGQFSDSAGSQVGYVPFDYKTHTWSKASDWKWQAVPMESEKLPTLVAPGELLGYISSEASEMTGIPAGLPVVAAAADKACEVLGSGCLSTQVGAISYGTTATINVTSERYIEPIALIPPYPSAVPAAYNLEIQVTRGFWLVSWFIREFADRERLIADKEGLAAEAIFDRLIAEIPPGTMGLTLQPHWNPGLKQPGLEAKGAIVGFSDVHTKVHIYRAILEGLGYALREGRERIERRTKVKMTELRVSGGGSQSNQAMQITADIFNLPAVRPDTYETSGLGAAMVAAVGLKYHADFVTASKCMTRTSEAFEPNQQNVKIYEELYQQIYKKMYPRLRPLYEAIRSITG